MAEFGKRLKISLLFLTGGGSILFKSLADLLWPPVCAVCSRLLPLADESFGSARHFCPQCSESIEFMPSAFCSICGRPYYHSEEHVCGDCLAAPPVYRMARSAVVYHGSVARSISLLKYYGDLTQLKVLADMARPLAEAFMNEKCFDAIVPMPISSGRQKERGFNQALELALFLFAPWRALIEPDLLRRPGNERTHQAGLSAVSRSKAVKGCFAVEDPQLVHGAKLVLFDDVFTTGATASEAAGTLIRAGAAQVDVLTIARAVRADWR